MNTYQAQLIAQLAHKGQKYGGEDYYKAHVAEVAKRCMLHRHCVDAHVVIAFLHDVVEDTFLTIDDMRTLGLEERLLTSLDAITKRLGERYPEYLTRVLADPIAAFVKYHDLNANLEACDKVRMGFDMHMSRSRATWLIKRRYGPALDRIFAEKPFWLEERA